jgi:hypothetical protein
MVAMSCVSLLEPSSLSAQAPAAAASDAPAARGTVVLLDPEGSPLARRLQQELEALGFRVEVRSARSAALAHELRAPHVIAAIEVRPARSGQVELVAVAPQSSDPIRRSLPIAARQDPAAAELVATRTVELLRALRLELEAAGKREGAPAAAARAAVEPEPEVARDSGAVVESSSAVLLGGAALSSAPPFRPGASGWFAMGWRATPRWSSVFEIAVPLVAANLERAEGEVEASMTSYRVGAWLESSRAALAGAGVGAGLGLEYLAFRGYAAEPYTSDDARQWTWGPWLRAGGALRLSSRLRAVTSVTAVLSLPPTTVRLAGRDVARFGRPSVHAAVGLEWAL